MRTLSHYKALGDRDIAYLESGDGNDDGYSRDLESIYKYVRKYGKKKCRKYVEKYGSGISFQFFQHTVNENTSLREEINRLKKELKFMKMENVTLKDDVMVLRAEAEANVSIRQPHVNVQHKSKRQRVAENELVLISDDDSTSCTSGEEMNHNQNGFDAESSVEMCNRRKPNTDSSTDSSKQDSKLGLSDSKILDTSDDILNTNGNISSNSTNYYAGSLQGTHTSKNSSLNTVRRKSDVEISLEESVNLLADFVKNSVDVSVVSFHNNDKAERKCVAVETYKDEFPPDGASTPNPLSVKNDLMTEVVDTSMGSLSVRKKQNRKQKIGTKKSLKIKFNKSESDNWKLATLDITSTSTSFSPSSHDVIVIDEDEVQLSAGPDDTFFDAIGDQNESSDWIRIGDQNESSVRKKKSLDEVDKKASLSTSNTKKKNADTKSKRISKLTEKKLSLKKMIQTKKTRLDKVNKKASLPKSNTEKKKNENNSKTGNLLV